MSSADCPHPCRFRLRRCVDRGWGELAFEYIWDSTSGKRDPDGTLPDLAACFLYEFTTYSGNMGERNGDHLIPACPPFGRWTFRDPTDGRTGPVGMERFAACQGWAWDRHKLGGRLIAPVIEPERKANGSEQKEEVISHHYEIIAVQRYCFYCERCGEENLVSGPDSGPHRIVRTVASAPGSQPDEPVRTVWRYSISKHGAAAWLDWNASGYIGDSANIGFGPTW